MEGFIFISFILSLLFLAHFAEDGDDDKGRFKMDKELATTTNWK